MIINFQHKGLERLFLSGDASLLNPSQVKRIERLLNTLDACTDIRGMSYAGNRLHQLKGQRKGTWSVSVSGNWRITFDFEQSNAYNVDLEDYH